MKYSNSRTTHGGKGDTFRSDFTNYQTSEFWKYEWTSEYPEEEGQYDVKYYNENNKLIFDKVYCFWAYDRNDMPYMSINSDYLFTFCNDKVGVKWKFKGNN